MCEDVWTDGSLVLRTLHDGNRAGVCHSCRASAGRRCDTRTRHVDGTDKPDPGVCVCRRRLLTQFCASRTVSATTFVADTVNIFDSYMGTAVAASFFVNSFVARLRQSQREQFHATQVTEGTDFVELTRCDVM